MQIKISAYTIIVCMDKISKETRSNVMRRIKSKNTKPELFLRKELWHRGIRYRKNYKDVTGSPDIFISKYKTAIFVHGCFWHQHKDENCPLSHIPKSNSEFWKKKFKRNIERDLQYKNDLVSSSIQVIIVWECTINKLIHDDKLKKDFLVKLIYTIKNGDDLYYEF